MPLNVSLNQLRQIVQVTNLLHRVFHTIVNKLVQLWVLHYMQTNSHFIVVPRAELQ
jgi:hypothetical protein